MPNPRYNGQITFSMDEYIDFENFSTITDFGYESSNFTINGVPYSVDLALHESTTTVDLEVNYSGSINGVSVSGSLTEGI